MEIGCQISKLKKKKRYKQIAKNSLEFYGFVYNHRFYFKSTRISSQNFSALLTWVALPLIWFALIREYHDPAPHTQSLVHELQKLQLLIFIYEIYPVGFTAARSAGSVPPFQLTPFASIAFLIANTFQTRQMTIYYVLLLAVSKIIVLKSFIFFRFCSLFCDKLPNQKSAKQSKKAFCICSFQTSVRFLSWLSRFTCWTKRKRLRLGFSQMLWLRLWVFSNWIFIISLFWLWLFEQQLTFSWPNKVCPLLLRVQNELCILIGISYKNKIWNS